MTHLSLLADLQVIYRVAVRLALGLFVLGYGVASAQVGFSRACTFAQFNGYVQQQYAEKSGQTIDNVPIHLTTPEVKTQLKALESITTDYGNFRFWLLAYSGQYRSNQKWRLYQSRWDSRSLYDNNRGLATSVRAGADFVNPPMLNGAGLFELLGNETYSVIGVHYVFDPESGSLRYIGTSRATDCNCSQWGFEYSWANRLIGQLVCN